MKLKKAFLSALSMLICLALLSACGGAPAQSSAASTPGAASSAPAQSSEPAGGDQAQEKGVLKLGVLAPITGTNAEYGKGFEVAMTMAVEDLNAAGGVNGWTFELVVKDSKGDQKESSDLARQFADDDEIYAILGDFASGSCMANAPIVDEAGIVQISPTASSPDYAPMSPYCFGIMGLQSGEAPYYAELVLQKYLGAKTVGVIYINSDWGVSCFTNFEAKANAIGLDIVESVNYVQDEKDFSSLITKLRAANPDVIAIMDQGAVPQIINQIRGSGWDVPLTSLGPGTSQQLVEQAGENAEGLIVTSPFFFDAGDAVQNAWKDRFVEAAGFEPTIHPACAYDCVMLIAEAVKACGDGEVTRSAIRDNLAAVEMTGFTGPIKFNPDGDITRQYMICGVQDGEWVVLEGFDYAG